VDPAPFRLDPAATDKWRTGVNQDVQAGVVPTPTAALPPTQPVAPLPINAGAIPYTNPNVNAGPGGVTLASNPVAPGWAGTVGLPASPEEAKGFDKGSKYSEILSNLDDVAKGLKPKVTAPAIPNLVAQAPEPNQPNAMAYQLMAALMQGKNRGLTLTGR